jgi:hypothetical protein
MIEIPSIDFIFYHIEKCGGTSMRIGLYNYFNNIYNTKQIYESSITANGCIEFNKKNMYIIKNDTTFDYNNIKIILGHTRVYDLPSLFITTPLKITIIRNPLDRIISHYYHFDQKNYNCEMVDLPKNIFKKYCKGHGRHMCRVLNCIDSNNYFNVKKLKDIIKNLTYVLILENIDQDIKYLNKLLNNHYKCNYIIEINKLNTSKKDKNNIKEYDLLKEKIKPFCRPDFLLYNMVINYNKRFY